MRALAGSGYFVINLDARGHGESAWCPQGKYSLQTRALDLLAVMKNVCGPCALVGASMGGANAMYTVCTATDLPIAALVLVDIVPNPKASGVKRIHEFMRRHLDGFSAVDDAIAAVAAYNPDRVRPPDPHGMRKNLRLAANGRLKWHWDPSILSLDATTESRLLNQALDAAADRHTVPTLLVRGLRSDVVSDENVAQLRQRLPGLEVFNVEEAGTWWPATGTTCSTTVLSSS
jgi:pimeloyl-ACP methyl ester carboxylesterase